MNVAAMTAALRRRLGVSPGDGMLTPDVLRDLLDEANTMLEADADWPWRVAETTFSTVAGQRAYEPADFAPAGDWLRTIELKPEREAPLTLRTPLELDHLYPADEQGEPTLFAVSGSTILLGPTPISAVTITHRYVRVAPALSSEGDEPLMPAMFRWAIVAQAAALAHTRLGQDDRAQLATAEVDRWRARMVDDHRRARGTLRTRIRSGSAL